ncbi:MAG: molybdopterin-dependent oxidoreductase [Actinomycetales bacterium]|nr:molybdopterin-dependent oxidoreductase [Actinomycetales bacterium]
MSRSTGSPARRRWAALSGIVAAACYLAITEVIALLVPSGSALLAVGSFVIDIVPRPIKEMAIELFGFADKAVLLGSLGIAVVVGAAVAGLLELWRPPLGAILLGLVGFSTVAPVVTRAGASALSAIGPALGAAAAVIVLGLLVRRLRGWSTAAADGGQSGLDRRGFLRLLGVTAAASGVVALGSRAVSAATSSIQAARQALSLPAPASTVDVPAGAELEVDGLSRLFTPNAEFYRIDTALSAPRVDPETWRLRVTGKVGQEVELSFDDLVAMGLDEYVITLTCVSNVVGGELVGNARWLGVPLRDVLARAVPDADADMVLSRSVDGYTASTPLEACTDPERDAILAVAMNGEPLPVEHGFPVRMVVPGLYGYVSATKWVEELKVTRFDEDEAYWTPRGYAARAPIKMSSRIDTPTTERAIEAGPTVIAGMAWAQHTGIGQVEVSIDDGPWTPTRLSKPINSDTWVQWALDWEPEAGSHFVAVRAIDTEGNLQVEERQPIAPGGSTGWHRVLVQVR